MNKKLLIDSDVLLDFLFNVHYILSKKLGNNDSVNKLSILLKNFNIIPIDQSIVESALNSGHPDFEDSMQSYAAKSYGIDVIVTRNTKDYPDPEIEAMTPEHFLLKYGIQWGLQ